MIEKLSVNFHFVIASILFCIGLYIIPTKSNLIKKVMGLNLMETAVFLFAASIGMVKGSSFPVIKDFVIEIIFLK